jgi:hypothetical protein
LALSANAEILYQFPKGTYVENLAVRSNGNIVVVLLTAPEVWELNPSVKPATARLVHRFEQASRCTGIIETRPDVFAVLAGKMLMVLIPQSWVVAEINMAASPPAVRTVAPSVKGAGMLNGITLLNENAALVSDTMKGVVHRVDLRTGQTEVVMSGGLGQKRIPALGIGLNGIRTWGNSVWMSNTAKKGISKVPVDKGTGRPTGAAEVIGFVSWVDDFAISSAGDVIYATSHDQHALIKLDVSSGTQTVVAGGPKSGLMVGPTSAVFGRTGSERTIYVSTAGISMYPFNKAPDNGPGGGKVIAVAI